MGLFFGFPALPGIISVTIWRAVQALRNRHPSQHLSRFRTGSHPMCTETISISDTRLSLLMRVRDLADGVSWREFHAIYHPLICGYLRSLGLKEHDANDLTQE